MSNGDDNDAMVIARPSGNSIQRTGFGSAELEHRRETQSTAMAERAKAEVQARFIMAMQRPRDIDDVRVRLLKHCDRKGFALRAEYSKPVGGSKVTGPSIRFVETALQEYGNNEPAATCVYEDDEKRVMRVSVTEFERNVTYHDDAVIEKFVERKNPRDSEIIGSRTKQNGEIVYKVRATEDDLANKQAAAVSKKIRNLGLRILPTDLVEEAMEVCRETRQKDIAANPDAARHRIVDAFAELNVTPTHLTEFLGSPIAQASPADLDELRVIYATIRDGEARWTDILEAKRAERGEVEKPGKKASEAAEKVRSKIEARKAQTQNGKTAEAEAPKNSGGGQ